MWFSLIFTSNPYLFEDIDCKIWQISGKPNEHIYENMYEHIYDNICAILCTHVWYSGHQNGNGIVSAPCHLRQRCHWRPCQHALWRGHSSAQESQDEERTMENTNMCSMYVCMYVCIYIYIYGRGPRFSDAVMSSWLWKCKKWAVAQAICYFFRTWYHLVIIILNGSFFSSV